MISFKPRKAVNILRTESSAVEARRAEILEAKVDTTKFIIGQVLKPCES